MERIRDAPELNVFRACVDAGAEPARERPLSQQCSARTVIALVTKSRVLAPPGPAAGRDPRDRTALERALELHRRAPLAAPRQRHTEPRPWTKHVDEPYPRAV